MTLIELIGFVIILVAMVILMGKRAWDERQRRKYPKKFEEQQRQEELALREFLRSINVEDQELEAAALSEPLEEPPPLPPLEEFALDTMTSVQNEIQARLEKKHATTSKSTYVTGLKQQSRAKELIQNNRKHLSSIILLHEIIGLPKSLRS